MTAKIQTKDDLIRFIQGLPDDWKPTKCISWTSPEVVGLGIGYEEVEYRRYVEIEIDGPLVMVTRDTRIDK